jgi:hypothetical protein
LRIIVTAMKPFTRFVVDALMAVVFSGHVAGAQAASTTIAGYSPRELDRMRLRIMDLAGK